MRDWAKTTDSVEKLRDSEYPPAFRAAPLFGVCAFCFGYFSPLKSDFLFTVRTYLGIYVCHPVTNGCYTYKSAHANYPALLVEGGGS